MKHLKSFNESNTQFASNKLGVGGVLTHTGAGRTSQGSMSGYRGGNMGNAGGLTGPIAFYVKPTIKGYIPSDGPHTPVTTEDPNLDKDMPDYPRAEVDQSFRNDMKGKERKSVEDSLFGSSARRVNRLKSRLRQQGKEGGLFGDKENKGAGKIKSFKDYSDFADDSD